MPMKLPNGFRPPELRILQEYRRLSRKAMSRAEIDAIRHPASAEGAVEGLLEKGYLVPSGAEGEYALTPAAEELLAVEPVPEWEIGSAADEVEPLPTDAAE